MASLDTGVMNPASHAHSAYRARPRALGVSAGSSEWRPILPNTTHISGRSSLPVARNAEYAVLSVGAYWSSRCSEWREMAQSKSVARRLPKAENSRHDELLLGGGE